MVTEPKLPVKRIMQVCVIVDDLQKTIERYQSVLGIGPWRIVTFSPENVKDARYHGKPMDKWSIKAATALVGDLMYEVIQPMEGQTMHSDFLTLKGPGLQHLAILVEDMKQSLSAMEAEGYEVLMSGRILGNRGATEFAYLATDSDLATVIELVAIEDRGVQVT